MATKDPKVALIRKVPAFEGISDRELARLGPVFDEVRLEPGEVFIRQGRLGHEAFVIVEGTATVMKGRKKLATLGPGDLVGEIALIERGKRSATVKAESPVRMLVITGANFDALMERSSVRMQIATAMSRRLRSTEGAPRSLATEKEEPVATSEGTGAKPRWSRRRLVAAAIAIVMVVGGGSFYAIGKRATPVSVDEAVSRYRQAEASSTRTDRVVDPDRDGPAIADRAGAAVTRDEEAGTDDGRPSARIDRTASTTAGSLIAEGVYVYDTKGFEEVSVLGGARHEYPEQTTMTVERTECGADVRWDALEQRWDRWTTCALGRGIELRQFVTYHEFFKQVDSKTYVCPKGAMLRPSSDAAGTKTSGSCDSGEARVVINAKIVATEKVTVGDHALSAVHVRIDEVLTGATRGTRAVDSWYVPDTALLLKRKAVTDVDSKSAFGFTHYREEIEMTLSSLEPRR